MSTLKPVNQKAWLLILPIILCVAFSAIVPLMTVVNYSVQDIISPERHVFVGTEWFKAVMRDEELHGALLRQMAFSLSVLLVEIPLGIALALSMPAKGWQSSAGLVTVAISLLIPWNVVGTIWQIYGSAPILGAEKEVLHVARQMGAQEVVIAMERNLERPLFSQLVECQAQGIEVSWMPDLYERVCRSVPIQHVDPAWALSAMQGAPLIGRFQLAAKRMLDLTIVLLAAPVFLLLIPAIGPAIMLDSPGPVFYSQVRCGRAGKKFKILKFRTMVTNAERDGKPQWAKKKDPRITRVGQFLRKSRLDELPQIINVLLNDMSLVGPRPERPEFIETLEKEVRFYSTRLTVKPGITGWAQIHYDYGNSVEDELIKLKYDFYYIRYLSVVLDIYILFRTIGVLFKLKGT